MHTPKDQAGREVGPWTRTATRCSLVVGAALTGVVSYVLMILSSQNGRQAMRPLFFHGLYFSAEMLVLVGIASLALRIPPLRRAWKRRRGAPLAILGVGVVLLTLGLIGFRLLPLSDLELSRGLMLSFGLAWLVGSMLVIFAIVHLPWPESTCHDSRDSKKDASLSLDDF